MVQFLSLTLRFRISPFSFIWWGCCFLDWNTPYDIGHSFKKFSRNPSWLTIRWKRYKDHQCLKLYVGSSTLIPLNVNIESITKSRKRLCSTVELLPFLNLLDLCAWVNNLYINLWSILLIKHVHFNIWKFFYLIAFHTLLKSKGVTL